MEIEITAEEFYNACHLASNGKFCGKGGKKKGKIMVPMSEAARKSNALLRRMSADRRSKDYATAKKNIKGDWNSREKGQGGVLRDGLASKGQATKMRNERKDASARSNFNKALKKMQG